MSFRFEVAVDSLESALTAQDCGVDRIELCADLGIGGLTPSAGMIALASERLRIPIHVIIRPRRGDFLYSAAEFAIMRRDIVMAKAAGAQGVVLGMLLADGGLDLERTGELLELAKPMSLTFHRAFDMCRQPELALEQLVELGVQRLLSSGQAQSAEAGMTLLAALVRRAAGRIIIMPGAGINEANIRRIAEATGAREFHFSARQMVDGPMRYRKAGLSMGEDISEYARSTASAERIRDAMSALNDSA